MTLTQPAVRDPLVRRAARLPWEGLALAAVAIALALDTHSHHLHGIPDMLRASLAGLAVCLVCGEAAAGWLIPRAWGPLRLVFALPLGAALSGLVLLGWGFVHVPLHVSLWLTLALGLAASVLVRRSRPGPEPEPALLDRRTSLSWGIVLVVVFVVAILPALRTGADTIYGTNPDAHQVAGSAVLFQHAPPTATDPALPIDVIPPAWRFRYPIFYPLAAAANLSHLDPILVFPALSALLLVMAAFGFGALAVGALRAPARAGPLVSAACGLSVISLHLVWHPYWNQLWCLAMLPYALLFGWRAVLSPGRGAWILFGLMLLMLAVAYPLGLPDPVVVIVALLIAHRRRPRLPHVSTARGWAAAIVAFLAISPAVVGAAIKLAQGLGQFFSTSGSLWGGDVKQFVAPGMFVGAGGGIAPALAVLAFALLGLRWLERRSAWALGAGVALLALVDIRFRVTPAGSYMDFKQLSFVGPIVLTMAVTGAVRLLETVDWAGGTMAAHAGLPGRRGPGVAAAAALVLFCGWWVAAIREDRRENLATPIQVTAQMFQIRAWAASLPPGSSVRVDVPPSGIQLWAVYMLGSHPVDAPDPVLASTYAHAPYGLRADYSLGLRVTQTPNPADGRPVPAILYAKDPPLRENSQFVLRRIELPPRLRSYPKTASQTLVEP